MNLYNVFVYGTLLVGERNHQVAKSHVLEIVPGSIRGRLYNTGSFPALILDKHGYDVEGEWLKITQEGLQRMDELEGYYGPGMNNFYDRVEVEDTFKGIKGWVYTWQESLDLPEIKNGSWRSVSKSVKNA